MIVKDESPVIARCLESVKPFIDYWVIVDTGSSDGTQEIIKEVMKDIPGELHERPWVNFSHNRNEALSFAKGKSDYVLIIDADEYLYYGQGFTLPQLELDYYYIKTEYSGIRYARIQLIKNDLNWQWVGVVHETLQSPYAFTSDTLGSIINIATPEGHRSLDPDKYMKDAMMIEEALRKDPTNSRYVFYLAQSLRDAGHYEDSIAKYKERVAMGGWDQEIFWSLLQIAKLQEDLSYDEDDIAQGYLTSHNYRPTRLEPLYYLTLYYRKNQLYQKGYDISRQSLILKTSNDILFTEQWIYDYGLLLEFSLCAYYSGHYLEALLASYLILSRSTTPQHVRSCTENNLYWIEPKVRLSLGL